MAVEALEGWINPTYLELGNIQEIAVRFSSEHALVLPDFFKVDRIAHLMQSPTPEVHYVPEQHHYARGTILGKIRAFLVSDAFQAYLELLTGARAPQIDLVSFGHRDYTLLHQARLWNGLRVVLCLNDWQQEWGGIPTYKQPEGDVLRLPVQANTLALVYVSEEQQEYFSYVNHHAPGRVRYLLARTPTGDHAL